METLKSIDELIQRFVVEANPLKKLGMRAESRPGQFPYRFSYCRGDDRFEAEFNEEELRILSDDLNPVTAFRNEFARKMAL
jgi:hypothetical protein